MDNKIIGKTYRNKKTIKKQHSYMDDDIVIENKKKSSKNTMKNHKKNRKLYSKKKDWNKKLGIDVDVDVDVDAKLNGVKQNKKYTKSSFCFWWFNIFIIGIWYYQINTRYIIFILISIIFYKLIYQ